MWRGFGKARMTITYARFADYVGAKDRQVPTWNDLREAFTTHMEQRRNIGKLQGSTEERYNVTVREFESFLIAQKIMRLQDIGAPQVAEARGTARDLCRFQRFLLTANELGSGH